MVEGYTQIGNKYYKNEDVQAIFDTRIKSFSYEEIAPEEPTSE